jgi:hypothetical protein
VRDDLPCLLDQFANDLTGWLDLADQTNALARQQVHRIDIPARIRISIEPGEYPTVSYVYLSVLLNGIFGHHGRRTVICACELSGARFYRSMVRTMRKRAFPAIIFA